jgi:hypothetical protein
MALPPQAAPRRRLSEKQQVMIFVGLLSLAVNRQNPQYLLHLSEEWH